MPDRASHLAKQLIERMRSLEESLSDDADGDSRSHDQRRSELIAKVLAIYAGVTDGPTVQVVSSAMPAVPTDRPIPERERDEFAAFLRARIRFA